MIDLTHSNGINIPHLSPSTITSFIEYRTNWFNSKVLCKPFVANPNMVRGTAVEHAINKWLEGAEVESLYGHAEFKYRDELHAWISLKKDYDEEKDEIFQSLRPLVDCAYAHFNEVFDVEFNPPTSQEFVEIRLPGVKRKIVGYMDYRIPNAEVHDCKIVGKTPSKLKQAYIIQGSMYRKHTGMPMVFDFIVANKKPKAVQLKLTDEEYSFGLAYATAAAKVLEELEECENPTRVMELMCFPNLEAFFNPVDRLEAARQWSIY